ncbi:MurR/RpiR family transcriptional regulator [Spiroplasma eriocheiris]|uniref:RpiR family transcriptional regulator n=1 Tax=Spiroplasma eriocheiris TaxID=315358 RepID=A0A0H3XKK1_9MOLU|nr:SIS domain-containing protein [Spiroplasma eriocheiris]AHF58009.1 putative phosphosugar-binding transcriptional regulator [Spiroplasma eriocheiris CCTCC M 207170]AKM54451.1 RpiR family transcriptional regulator [Spiroplasma eriocheiris]
MAKQQLLKQIKELAKDDNPIRSSIASVILDNLDHISKLSIVDIAKLSNVSTTVIRFCNSLGLSGFKELKMVLKFLSLYHISDDMSYAIDNSLLNQSMKFLNQYNAIKYQASLELSNLYEDLTIYNLAKIINERKRIHIFAFSLAYKIASIWATRLGWLNIQTFCLNDYNLMENQINLIHDEDICLFITLSGQNKQLANFLATVEENTNNLQIYVIMGQYPTQLFNDVENKIIIHCDEQQIWDSYSITAQTLIQFLDLVYYELLNKVIKK